VSGADGGHAGTCHRLAVEPDNAAGDRCALLARSRMCGKLSPLLEHGQLQQARPAMCRTG